MTGDSAPFSVALPKAEALLVATDWGAFTDADAMGSAADAPQKLAQLLDDDERVRLKALSYLIHVLHHQNTLYLATVPAALYVAAILDDPRTTVLVDRSTGPAVPLLVELLDWIASVAREADNEAEKISRRHGFDPDDHEPFVQVRGIRPQLFSAAWTQVQSGDQAVREAAICACVPLLDDPRLLHLRGPAAGHLRKTLAFSADWRHRGEAVRTLEAWGDDTAELKQQIKAREFVESANRDTGWTMRPAAGWAGWANVDDPPF